MTTRTAQVITTPENNKGAIVIVEGYGTMTMIGFAQVLYNAGLIDYKKYFRSKKIAFSSDFATSMVNANESLFPTQF